LWAMAPYHVPVEDHGVEGEDPQETMNVEARLQLRAPPRRVPSVRMERGDGALMSESPGRVFTREQLLDLAKGSAEEAFDRSMCTSSGCARIWERTRAGRGCSRRCVA
jgi:hypothetical protein